MARTAAALVKQADVPADVAGEGLRAVDLAPERFTELDEDPRRN
jgi:hypothetical protein